MGRILFALGLALAVGFNAGAQDNGSGSIYLPDRQTAVEARDMLLSHSPVRLFCEPCGDRYVQEVRVYSVAIDEHNEESKDTWLLRINGGEIPLGQIYLRREGSWWSLPHLLGLDPPGVPEEIYPFLRARPVPPQQ